MTDARVRERTRTPRTARRTNQRAADRMTAAGRWARLRATVRLAVRQVRRTPGSSFLVITLIALPITALTAGAVFYESHQPTPAQTAAFQLGQADSRVMAMANADPRNRQVLNDFVMGTVPSADDVVDFGEVPTGLPEGIPASADLVEVSEAYTPLFATEHGAAGFTLFLGPVWEDRFAGAFDLVSGTAPTRPDEVLATAAVLDSLGASVGDTISTRAESGAESISVTVTGIVDSPQLQRTGGGFVAPMDSVLSDWVGTSTWYVFGWQPTLPELTELNQAGYAVLARNLILDPPPYPDDPGSYDGGRVTTYTLGIVGGVFFSALVALIAGAAMSVSARRQQRSLAVAASVGAGRGALFAVVLGQGVVLGLAGAGIGIALGMGIAAAVLAVTDHGDPWSMRGNWGYHVPLVPIIGVAVLAVVVGVVAAVVPARSATRGDTLAALRGARRPVTLRRRMPRWGAGVLATGILASIVAIVMLAVSGATRTEEVAVVATIMVIAGPLLILLGIGLCGHWLLTVIAQLGARASVASRLALRDLAANPSRTVPAFLAIATAVLVATATLSMLAITTAASARTYSWNAPMHSIVFRIDTQLADSDAAVKAAQRMAASVGATGTVVSHISRPAILAADSEEVVDPEQVVAFAGWPGCEYRCIDGWSPYGSALTVIAPEDLAAATGLTVTDADLRAFTNGSAIITAGLYENMSASAEYTHDEAPDAMRVFHIPAPETMPGADTAPWSEAVRVEELPFRTLPGRTSSMAVMISPDTAEALGIDTVPELLIAAMPRALSAAESERIIADIADDTSGVYYAEQEHGPDSGIGWLALVTALATAIVIGTAVVTLGLARFERRPDDATLTSVGGSAAVRRRINAVQALSVAGIGSVAGAAIGLLPVGAFIATMQDSFGITGNVVSLADAPWVWIGALAIGLPLTLAAVAWIITPRRSDLVRRTAIT